MRKMGARGTWTAAPMRPCSSISKSTFFCAQAKNFDKKLFSQKPSVPSETHLDAEFSTSPNHSVTGVRSGSHAVCIMASCFKWLLLFLLQLPFELEFLMFLLSPEVGLYLLLLRKSADDF